MLCYYLQNTLMTVNLEALPDKGRIWIEKEKQLLLSLQEEEQVLEVMLATRRKTMENSKESSLEDDSLKEIITLDNSIEYVDNINQKEIPVAQWVDLEAQSSDVQPKTFGKRAMATHNLQKALTMDRLHQLHGSLATRPEDHEMATDPYGIKVELMPHQKHAIAWMMWRENQRPNGGILADDMGLGKTLTMIALLLKCRESEEEQEDNDENDDSDDENQTGRYKYEGGTLVICPTSLISQWEGEVKTKLRRKTIVVEIYHGPKRECKAKRYDFQNLGL